jgi:hypothetical protein
MQGDIYQLENLLHCPQKPTTESQKMASSLAPNYEKEYLSQYLFRENEASKDAKLNDIYTHARYLETIASAFDDYCSDLPSDYYSDKSGLTTDDEGHSSEEPSSPATPSRQTSTTGIKSQRKSNAKVPAPVQKDTPSPVVAKTVHVSQIQGSLMSLWPLPIEYMEHEWNEKFYE